MEEKARIMSEVMTALTYIGSFVTVFLGFLGTYSLGFGVIFAGFTCWVNWRLQNLRTKLLQEKKDDSV